MAGNIFGKILTLTTFGESHGVAVGGIIDGFPSGLKIDLAFVQHELNRRRPGQSSLVSSRNEKDKVEFLSGLYNGVSLGTPIAFLVRNSDFKSSDYEHLKEVYRPSHADYTYESKYGVRDHRGGGRASARETVARVIGGALAKQFLDTFNISVMAYVNQIGSVSTNKPYPEMDFDNIENSKVRCPDNVVSEKMIELIKKTEKDGDTLGGEITCVIKNMQVGIGEPVFNKLNADLANAIVGINAVKGFEFGSGFASSLMTGSQHNDEFIFSNDAVHTTSNYSGGIQGGISNGEDIYFKAAFKPIATIMKSQQTVDKHGNSVVVVGKGRHDVTVVPRAVPIVEAMAALVIADQLLQSRASKLVNTI